MQKSNFRYFITLFVTIVTCFSSTALPVSANDGTSSGKEREPRPVRTEMPRLEKIEKMASKASEAREKMEEKRTKIASRASDMKDKMEKIASKAGQRFEDRCKLLNERTAATLNKYQTNKSKHIESVTQAQKKLEEVIERLKKDGIDTVKLESDLSQLKILISKAQTDYAAFITTLKDTQNFACGKSEGAYAEALKASQEKLITARQSLIAIRTFYQTTIRPDLQVVKTKKSPRPSTSAKASPQASTTTANPTATTAASTQ